MADNSHTTSPSIIAVPFQADTLIAVEREDGIYIAIRPICERLGLQWSGQLQRIKRHPILAEAVCMTHTPFTRHGQEETCLKLDYLNGWLMGVDAGRVKPTVRDALIEYQRECHRVLFEHFFRKSTARRGAATAEAAEQRRFNNSMRERGIALRERAAALRERQQWTRELHEIRMSGVSRQETAKAAREFCRRIGIDLDDTLAQGEFPFKQPSDDNVH